VTLAENDGGNVIGLIQVAWNAQGKFPKVKTAKDSFII
jgi:hypothetical protein